MHLAEKLRFPSYKLHNLARCQVFLSSAVTCMHLQQAGKADDNVCSRRLYVWVFFKPNLACALSIRSRLFHADDKSVGVFFQ